MSLPRGKLMVLRALQANIYSNSDSNNKNTSEVSNLENSDNDYIVNYNGKYNNSNIVLVNFCNKLSYVKFLIKC